MRLRKSLSWPLILVLLFCETVFPFSLLDDKIVIAVVDFRNTGNDESYDYLENTIPEAIITYLAKAGNVEIVERSRLKDALKEMELGMSGILDEQTAVEVGKAVGANAILVGSFVSIGDVIRINARLIDVKTSRIIKAEIVQGGVGKEIFNLMDEMASSIEAQLIGETEEVAQIPQTPPQTPQIPQTPINMGLETRTHLMTGNPFYKSRWFLAAVGVGIVGGAAIVISSDGGDDKATINISVTIP